MSNWLTALGRLMRRENPQTGWLWSDRQYQHLLWDAYYHNTIYETTFNGGQRENINTALGNASAADLAGLYNPVAAVVDLYLHVFAGDFGKDIFVESDNSAVRPAIEKIWGWSQMNIERQPLCRLAATHGCVGLRLVARNADDPAQRRVYIKVEHPQVIRAVQLDDRGNVEAIQLEYDRTTGLAEEAETIRIREDMDKGEIRTYRVQHGTLIPYDLVNGRDNGPLSSYPNELGFVPYVLLRHEHDGSTFGNNAFYRARGPIDRINALVSHIDVQIHRHVRAKWVIAANGAAPAEIDLGDLTVAYIDTRNGGTPPLITPMVAPLNLADAITQSRHQIELIEDMLPELKATAGKFLANQSGETVAQLRKPAQDKVRLARTNYEDPLVRIQEMGLSWGIAFGLWDLGTGMGTRQAADAAFTQGLEEHRFNTRPVLEDDKPAAPKPMRVVRPPAATVIATNGKQQEEEEELVEA